MAEIKIQLDADTGEERRWEEQKIDEVIDLTGSGDEGEEVAVNQVISDEENYEGNGEVEEAINQVKYGDDRENKSEERDGEMAESGKGDGKMAHREEACGGEIGGGKGREDDDSRNGKDCDEVAESANALSTVSSDSATTEAWDGDVGDEEVEMDVTEGPCNSPNEESISPALNEKLSSKASESF